jgi:hypothetical protein
MASPEGVELVGVELVIVELVIRYKIQTDLGLKSLENCGQDTGPVP